METLVLEIGSGKTKIGFAGSELPSNVYQTIIGKRFENSIFEKNFYIGQEVVKNYEMLNVSTPVERGKIKDFDALEKIIQYSLSLDQIESFNILYVTSVETDTKTKHKISELLFEKFNAQEISLQKTPLLSLFSSGKITGISVELGHGFCSTNTVIDGKFIQGGRNGKQILYIGGYDLTKQIIKSLNLKSHYNRFLIANQIKEKYCSFLDQKEVEYKLPDGKMVMIHDERKLGEILFQPMLIDNDSIGLKDLIIHSIENIEQISQRKSIASNIFLSGGTSLIKGMDERVERELKDYHINTNLIQSQTERQYASWIGGSMICSEKSLCHFVSSENYKENGSKLIEKIFND